MLLSLEINGDWYRKDNFVSAISKSSEEACRLIEKGWDYVGKINGEELWKKTRCFADAEDLLMTENFKKQS